MKTKHTQGEWIDNDGYIEVDCEPLPSKSMYYTTKGDKKEKFGHLDLYKEADANDKLKAAAPELLKALELSLNYLPKESIEYKNALKAIKKATK